MDNPTSQGFTYRQQNPVQLNRTSSFCLWLARWRLHWLAALGRASLAIYVMHILAGSGARIVMQKMLGIDAVAVHLVVGTVAGIVLPLLALGLIERLGLRGWLGLGR